jgi:hypothetical protein
MTIGTLGYITFPHSTRVGDPNYVITGGGTGLGLSTPGSLFIATGGSASTFIISSTGAVTASGTIITRNGTSPTSIQITNTYTSATSFGLLDIRANAAQTAYEISSFLGSAGGAALPINIGHRDSAGTFTSALSVATSGAITASATLTAPQFVSNGNGYYAGSTGIRIGSGNDITLICSDNTTLQIRKPVAIRNVANSADAALTCGAITASGAITPATLTDAAAPNGSIYYSSTASKLVYKDSGGVVNNLY